MGEAELATLKWIFRLEGRREKASCLVRKGRNGSVSLRIFVLSCYFPSFLSFCVGVLGMGYWGSGPVGEGREEMVLSSEIIPGELCSVLCPLKMSIVSEKYVFSAPAASYQKIKVD